MFTKRQKFLALLLCASIIVTTLFSAFFIIKEKEHDCKGEDCFICACIHQAQQMLKQMGFGIVEVISFSRIEMIFYVLSIVFLFVICISLVSQKVRMNN